MVVTLSQRTPGGARSNCAISFWQPAVQHPETAQRESVAFCVCVGVRGFFLACKDLGVSLTIHSPHALFFLKWRLGHAH